MTIKPFATSLDRLTILGTIHNVPDFKMFIENDGRIISKKDFQSPQYDHSGSLLGMLPEGSAFFSFCSREHKIRFEFNPKHASDPTIKQAYEDFIGHIRDPYLSRVDVAFDFEHNILDYKIFDNTPNRKEIFVLGQDKAVETRYLGTRRGEVQIVFYDKLRERKEKNKTLPEDLSEWKRVEVKLMTSKYLDEVFRKWDEYNPFKNVRVVQDLPKSAFKSIQEWALAKAIVDEPSIMADLDKRTRSKYRKLLGEIQTQEVDLKEIWEHEKTPIMAQIRGWVELAHSAIV
jgi:hypothetical protein